MKKTITLKEFIEKGKFGEIEIGQSKNEIINYLGTNFDFGDFGETFILKYGWFEFYFWADTEKLYAIQNDSLSYVNGYEFENDRLSVDRWFLKNGLTLRNAKTILHNENVEFVQQPYMEHCENLAFESGVNLDFFNETSDGKEVKNKEDYEFGAIRLFKE